MPEYLTTRELADLLRIGERKVYDLAGKGEVPHVRALGKLLFPRSEITRWLAASRGGPEMEDAPLPAILAGSHDPLLDWALQQSGAGLASLCNGSFDGLARLANRQALAAGLHIAEPQGWNVTALTDRMGHAPVVLVELARRQRGLLLAPDAGSIDTLAQLDGTPLIMRQETAASQRQFITMLAQAGVTDVQAISQRAQTEQELAIALREGKAMAGFGLAAMASLYDLRFVPLTNERFDLAVWRRAWFDPPMQALMAFLHSDAFATRAAELGGYDLAGLGNVHHNGASG